MIFFYLMIRKCVYSNCSKNKFTFGIFPCSNARRDYKTDLSLAPHLIVFNKNLENNLCQ